MSEYADGFDDGKGEKFDELMVEIVALRQQLKEAEVDAARYGRVKQFLQYGDGSTLDARGTDSAAFDALIDALAKEEGR
jgi:hypothetical protein